MLCSISAHETVLNTSGELPIVLTEAVAVAAKSFFHFSVRIMRICGRA